MTDYTQKQTWIAKDGRVPGQSLCRLGVLGFYPWSQLCTISLLISDLTVVCGSLPSGGFGGDGFVVSWGRRSGRGVLGRAFVLFSLYVVTGPWTMSTFLGWFVVPQAAGCLVRANLSPTKPVRGKQARPLFVSCFFPRCASGARVVDVSTFHLYLYQYKKTEGGRSIKSQPSNKYLTLHIPPVISGKTPRNGQHA
jgi:hypothetical protein